MINISLERAIEKLVDMTEQRINLRILVVTNDWQSQFHMYNEIQNVMRLRCYYQPNCEYCDSLYNIKTDSNVSFKTKDFVSKRGLTDWFSLVLVDTKIDPKFHDEIRLSLRQNSVIPKEKQIQFFDIEQDKVWFEEEYQRELYERYMDNHTNTNEVTSVIEWIQKQIDSGKAKVVKTTPDNWFDYIKILGIPSNQIDVGMSIKLTEDKREDEQPMDNHTNTTTFNGYNKTNYLYVPKITDIEILQVLNKETDIEEPKVTKITFADGTNMKMVCHEEDTFDLRRCLFIAIAKKLYKDRYTWEGIEHKATELSYLKSVTKVVDKALKVFNRKQEEIAKLEKNAEEEKKSRAKKKAKHDAYLKRRDERRQKEKDEQERQKFEYDVAVQVEAARRIKEDEMKMYYGCNCDSECNCDNDSDWDSK